MKSEELLVSDPKNQTDTGTEENDASGEQSENCCDAPEECCDEEGRDSAGVESLRQELEVALGKVDEHWQQCLRTAAELENVRKRAKRDVEHAHKFGQEKFALDVLNVRDSMAMGLDAAKESATVDALTEGSEMTLKLLNQVLDRHGVKEIHPEGQPFNPEQHEAMSVIDAPDVAPNTVVQVIQAGFEINGRLLRPARVLVSRA